MSGTEVVAVVAATVLLLAGGGRRRWVHRRLVPVAAVVAAVTGIALVVGGLRWQLVPVLAVAVVSAAVAVRPAGRSAPGPHRRWVRGIATGTGLVLLAGGALSAWALPVPSLPVPAGGRPIGTTVLQWTDTTRTEPATTRPDDHRTVVVQLWYPARRVPGAADGAPYLGRDRPEADVVVSALSQAFGVPALLLDGLARAHGHAVLDAPLDTGGGRYPLVLFSPGLGGIRTQNTSWAEHLAGRGYVVAALDHPYDSAVVVLADGRAVPSQLAPARDEADAARLRAAWTATRVADLRFALTRLGSLDRGEPPTSAEPVMGGALTASAAGHLDLDRVAVAGHSLGGAAAAQTVRQDPRFDAAVVLDGAPTVGVARPFPQPVLALANPTDHDDGGRYATDLAGVLDLSTAPSYRVVVTGSAHLTFTDAPLFLPPVPSLVGSLGRTAGPALTATATTAFLDNVLRGGTEDVPAVLARYGRVTEFNR